MKIEGAAPFEDSGLFTFFQTALFIQHASVQYSACSLARHYRTDMNVHNNVLANSILIIIIYYYLDITIIRYG